MTENDNNSKKDTDKIDHSKCVPLCGATSAYGKRVKLRHHSPMCTVRKEYTNEED